MTSLLDMFSQPNPYTSGLLPTAPDLSAKIATGWGSQVVPAEYRSREQFQPSAQEAFDTAAKSAALRLGVPEIHYTSGTDGHSVNHRGWAMDIDMAKTLAPIGDTPENRAKLFDIGARSGMLGSGTYAGETSPFPNMLHWDTTPPEQNSARAHDSLMTWNRAPVSDSRYIPEIKELLAEYRQQPGNRPEQTGASLDVSPHAPQGLLDTHAGPSAPSMPSQGMTQSEVMAQMEPAPAGLLDELNTPPTDLLNMLSQPQEQQRLTKRMERGSYGGPSQNQSYWRSRWLKMFGPTSRIYAYLDAPGTIDDSTLTDEERAELANYRAT
jgi:hypothetical protein